MSDFIYSSIPPDPERCRFSHKYNPPLLFWKNQVPADFGTVAAARDDKCPIRTLPVKITVFILPSQVRFCFARTKSILIGLFICFLFYILFLLVFLSSNSLRIWGFENSPMFMACGYTYVSGFIRKSTKIPGTPTAGCAGSCIPCSDTMISFQFQSDCSGSRLIPCSENRHKKRRFCAGGLRQLTRIFFFLMAKLMAMFMARKLFHCRD